MATQGVGAVTPGSYVTIQGGTFSAQGNRIERARSAGVGRAHDLQGP